MEQRPLVTVLLVLYRKFDNVYRALDSILNQTYNNIELIVTDDGSPNFPQNEICEYINNNKTKNIVNVQILDNKVNVGTVKHANNAFYKANGILLKGLAGDDVLYDSHVIDKIVQRYIEKPFNVLSTSSISFNNDGTFYRFYPHVKTGKKINKILNDAKSQYIALSRWKYHDLASGSTMVFNVEFFRKIGGFNEAYKLWEDGPFMYAMTKAGYKIDTAFDIISIKYNQGGISTGGGNPIIEADVAKLIKKTKEDVIPNSGYWNRRWLNYLYKINQSKTKLDRYIIHLVYPDIFICYYFYNLGETRRGKKDIEYYKEIKRFFV